MRILHISTRLILGGSQENTVLSCEGQARAGHEVHLAFGPIYGPEGSLLERVERFRTADGRAIATHVVPHLVREIRPAADLAARAELRRLIRELRPDVVHTHSSKAGILGRAAAWAEMQSSGARMAVVHTIHGPPFMPVEGGPASRLKTLVMNGVYTLAERYAARRCHAIIGVANAMVEQFVVRRIGRPQQYHTVYSGMETEAYLNAAPGETRDEARGRLGLGPGDFVIGTVARLAQHKGHDDVLDALAEDLRAEPSWRLLWVGDGWRRGRLLERARGLGLSIAELDKGPDRDASVSPAPPASLGSAQLLVTGLVPPGRIPGLMRAMDVLVHPSYREGLPRTVPQALLCGVCPIAYDADGTGEACREMKTGRLVPTGDVAALRSAVRWAAENPLAREALAARGREDCRVRFSAEEMVRRLEAVYLEVLEAAR